MNIVIGGASGAMPPLLGWTAITGRPRRKRWCSSSSSFCGRRCAGRSPATGATTTPKAGLPMLPVTHGHQFTCRQSLIYAGLLSCASIIPYTLGMSGIGYFIAAGAGCGFVAYVLALAQLQR